MARPSTMIKAENTPEPGRRNYGTSTRRTLRGPSFPVLDSKNVVGKTVFHTIPGKQKKSPEP